MTTNMIELPIRPPIYPNTAALPPGVTAGSQAIVLSTPPTIYINDGTSWVLVTDGGLSQVNTVTSNGNGLTADPTSGNVVLTLAQSILSSATPQFAGMGLGGALATSAILSLSSTSLGFLPPRLTTAQKNLIATPATGLIVFDTDIVDIEFYNGSAWVGTTVSGVTSITATAPITANVSTGAVTIGITTPIALNYGGTNANLTASLGGIVYSTASAMAVLSGTVTANQIVMSGSSAAPAWSTATYPATTVANQILFSSALNTIGGITAANNGVLISGTGGIPSWLAAGTTGQVLIATTSNPASWSSSLLLAGALTLQSGIYYASTTISTSTTLTSANSIVLVDTSTNTITVTLPVTVPANGWTISIKDKTGNAATHNITIAGNGHNIDSSANYIISQGFQSVTITSDGTVYSII
jgi:hypothetical protein